MRVWIADDQEEDLIADIKEYHQSKLKKKKKKKDPNSDVTIRGVSSVVQLKDLVVNCASGQDQLPDMIFLDLSFSSPEEGIDALRYLKFHDNLDVRNIPVVMYSQSDSLSDVYVTISYRANAYLTKDGGLGRFWDAVSHWRSTQLPPHSKPEGLKFEILASND